MALLSLSGILLAPDVRPILTPASATCAYGPLPQVLADWFGWESVTHAVEAVYAGLPAAQRVQVCVVTSTYGEARALQQLASPGNLPPIISGHNNYYSWGPGACTGDVLITVGYSSSDVQHQHGVYSHIKLAAVDRCRNSVSFERTLPTTSCPAPIDRSSCGCGPRSSTTSETWSR